MRAVLSVVLVATAGSELRDSLDTNVQGFELLSDDALRHSPSAGVLLGRVYAGNQVLVTGADVEVASGLLLRGPDVSQEMRLGDVSEETSGPGGYEPLGVEVSDPLGLIMATGPANTAAYVTLPSGSRFAGCGLQLVRQ